MTVDEFEKLPFVVVGGGAMRGKNVHIVMREGYDRPLDSVWNLVEYASNLDPGVWLVGGSEDNPLFSWPTYARVTTA